MEARGGLDQAGNLAFLQLDRRLIEGLEHLAFDEHIAVRVACEARVLADLVHHVLKVLARIQAVEHLLRHGLGLFLGAGFARGRVGQRDQDMLSCNRVRIGLLKLGDQLLVRRQVDAVFAVVVFIQRTVARAAVHHVGVSIRRKAHARQHLRIGLFAADRLDRAFQLLLQFLLLVVADLQTGLVKVLQHNVGGNHLIIRRVLHHLHHRAAGFLVAPDVGHAELGIHLLVVQHVVIQHGCIFIRAHLVAVNRHDDRRVALHVLIVDGRAVDAPERAAHRDCHHHNQRDNALNHFTHVPILLASERFKQTLISIALFPA